MGVQRDNPSTEPVGKTLEGGVATSGPLPFSPGLVPVNSQNHFTPISIQGCDYYTWK